MQGNPRWTRFADKLQKSMTDEFKLDGVTVDYDDWWFNVRPSNTEPALRLNLEANTQQVMEKNREKVIAIIKG